VSQSASASEIKSAFRQKARKLHPDVNPSADAKEQFQKVNRAYEILSDPKMKQRYDQFGEAGVGSSAASEGGGFGGGQQVDLSDIFADFFGGGGMGGSGRGSGFGGGGQQQRQRGPVAGDDLRFDLEIDFEKAIFGGKQKLSVRHKEQCTTCGGDGVKPGASVKTCGTCRGAGVVMQVTRTPLGNFQTQQACPTCRGEGKIVEEFCGTCSGQGIVQKSKEITVSIPPGVEDGNKLRVRGEGDAGAKGAPAGDLYIFLKVKQDGRFRREGPEIYSDKKVSYTDAILGATVAVETVDGNVDIKVPPGTQPGQVMRIKGKGAPRLGNKDVRGDHFVTVTVDIPKKISEKEKQLVEQLREMN